MIVTFRCLRCHTPSRMVLCQCAESPFGKGMLVNLLGLSFKVAKYTFILLYSYPFFSMDSPVWPVRDRILSLQTQWFTLIGEHLQIPEGPVLEYWRVEKVDSVVVLPIQNQQIIVPVPMYRPGVGKATLDFPGGRCLADQSPAQAARSILQRELDISPTAISHLVPLNQAGWAINSSFSNQMLYGFVAHLKVEAVVSEEQVEATYPINPAGFEALLEALHCLQCRLVLREWQAAQIGENFKD